MSFNCKTRYRYSKCLNGQKLEDSEKRPESNEELKKVTLIEKITTSWKKWILKTEG